MKIENLPRSLLWLVILVITTGIAWSDVETGGELGYSLFYLLPVFLSTWYLGRSSGVVISILCGLGVLEIFYLENPLSEIAFVPIWNSVVHLGVFLVTCFILSSLKEALGREQQLARVDPLTQVVNLRGFEERLNLEIARSRRSGQPFTLAYLDVDDFKAINDSFGHSVGDKVLSLASRALQQGVRSTDFVARLGGDEFAILLPETDLEKGRIIVEKLRVRLRAEMSKHAWAVTFSFGLHAFEPTEDPLSLDSVIGMVDTLMYEAKKAGKNRVCVHGQTPLRSAVAEINHQEIDPKFNRLAP